MNLQLLLIYDRVLVTTLKKVESMAAEIEAFKVIPVNSSESPTSNTLKQIHIMQPIN
jgi:hypothetical protein